MFRTIVTIAVALLALLTGAGSAIAVHTSHLSEASEAGYRVCIMRAEGTDRSVGDCIDTFGDHEIANWLRSECLPQAHAADEVAFCNRLDESRA